ncbi:MAG: DUF1992 domain-containing protein [Anaerolineaceae bacterium]|nr:DUF1992 domain-containing protein [Anaerolineaceae bacterium]
MKDWVSLVEQRLQRAQAAGIFDALPGEGKPLPPLDDAHTPPEQRLAHSLLRAHDLAPEWIALGMDVERRRARLLRGALDSDKEKMRLNRDILRYNLMAPAGIPRKALLTPDT